MVLSDDAARRAAALVLGRLDERSGTPVVVREGLSLLVRGGDVLVRVRPVADALTATREVAVARLLADAGVDHVGLVDGADQPWTVDGFVITGWAWRETVGAASSAQLGALARQLRDRTGGAVGAGLAPFEPLVAIRHAVSAVPVGDDQGDFVRHRAQELSSAWEQIAAQDPAGTAVVHGDLHVDNVLVTAAGPLLIDLELAGCGPCSYDTAPTVVAVERYGAARADLERFLEAQGHDPRSWPGFATCLAVYELWVTAWAVGARHRSREIAAEAAVRVHGLRDRTCEPWHLL